MTLLPSRRLDFSEIPLIDISPLVRGNSPDGAVQQIDRACRDVGFFYISHHGISRDLVKSLCQQSTRFFARPEREKTRVLINRRMRGYLPLFYRSYEGEENAGTSHQEGFWIGHENNVNIDRPLDGPNQWPAQSQELQSVMHAYFTAVEKVSHVLLRAFALALELPADYFHPMFAKPTSRLKLNHYPPQENPKDVNDIGVIPHSDSGGFTILWQDHNGGLEVQTRSGDWVEAPPIEDTFVVNIGNIMQLWSNGRFSSTPHRVINRGGHDRFSIPLFVNPDQETMIRPLIDTETVSFSPFNYGQYQLSLWQKTFPVAQI